MVIVRELTCAVVHGETDEAAATARKAKNDEAIRVHPADRTPPAVNVIAKFTEAGDVDCVFDVRAHSWAEAAALKQGKLYRITIEELAPPAASAAAAEPAAAD